MLRTSKGSFSARLKYYLTKQVVEATGQNLCHIIQNDCV